MEQNHKGKKRKEKLGICDILGPAVVLSKGMSWRESDRGSKEGWGNIRRGKSERRLGVYAVLRPAVVFSNGIMNWRGSG